MRGRSSGKTGPPVPGLTRVGGGAIKPALLAQAMELRAVGSLSVHVAEELLKPPTVQGGWIRVDLSSRPPKTYLRLSAPLI